MATHYKWLRVMINLAMTVFEREPVIPSPPVLMVLEEFPVLDHMRAIEVAAGQIAGFGVKLWTILQDLTQIQRLYRESWETFIGNAGIVTFFGNSDATTLDYVSRKLGMMGMRVDTPSGAPRRGAAHQRATARRSVAGSARIRAAVCPRDGARTGSLPRLVPCRFAARLL